MLAKRSCTAALLATTLTGVTPVIGGNLCRPALTLNEVQFSGMTEPTLERTWTAVVSVDASTCTADSKGYFDIVFRRLSENAPDLEFSKQFVWSAPSYVWPAPLVSVGSTFAADEAVAQYRIENITPCVCRD
jgi:hypothetical protein